MEEWAEALIAQGKTQGYLTHEQIDDGTPSDVDVQSIDALLLELEAQGVVVRTSSDEVDTPCIHEAKVTITRQQEIKICERISAIHVGIQEKMFRTGMSGKLHVGKGNDIVNDHELLKFAVPWLEGDERSEYLRRLPELVHETEQKDQLCAKLWNGVQSGADREPYEIELRRLAALLRQFRFSRQIYERILRQKKKPLLENAKALSTAGSERSAEVKELESVLRMSIHDFVELHRQLDNDFLELDAARTELVDSHQAFAESIAKSEPDFDGATLASALYGLRNAAKNYDHRRGYRFAEYAKHWIETYIEEKRAPRD